MWSRRTEYPVTYKICHSIFLYHRKYLGTILDYYCMLLWKLQYINIYFNKFSNKYNKYDLKLNKLKNMLKKNQFCISIFYL